MLFEQALDRVAELSADKKYREYMGGAPIARGYNLTEAGEILADIYGWDSKETTEDLQAREDKRFKEML
jgi:hypothetical protein